jgi:hypothetical protein
MESPDEQNNMRRAGSGAFMAECHRNAVPSRSLKMARLCAWQDEQAKDMLKAARAQTAIRSVIDSAECSSSSVATNLLVNTPPPKGGGFGLRLKAGFGRPHGPTGANSETFMLGAFVTTAW